MEANLTIKEPPPQWNSQPMYHLPPWGEPLVSWPTPRPIAQLLILCSRLCFQFFAVPCTLQEDAISLYSTSGNRLTIILTLTRKTRLAPLTNCSGMIRRIMTTLKITIQHPSISPNGGHVAAAPFTLPTPPGSRTTYVAGYCKSSPF